MSKLIFNDYASTPSPEAAGKTILYSKDDGNMYYMGSDGNEKLLYTGSSGGGGAPTDVQYLTLALDGNLSQERKIVAGEGIMFADGGANGNFVLTVPEKGAPTGSSYLVLAADGGLANERVFTAGTGITLVDAGAGGALTISAKGATMDDTWQLFGDLMVGLGDGQAGRLARGTPGYGLVCISGTPGLQYAPRRVGVNIPIGDGTNVIATGMFVPPISIPSNVKWNACYVLAHNGVIGSFEVDITKISYNGFPSGTSSVPATASRPKLTATNKSYDNTLTGWDLSATRGDVLQTTIITGSAAIKLATVALYGTITEVS